MLYRYGKFRIVFYADLIVGNVLFNISRATRQSYQSLFEPFKPNGISHCYQMEQTISVLRDVEFFFLFKF